MTLTREARGAPETENKRCDEKRAARPLAWTALATLAALLLAVCFPAHISAREDDVRLNFHKTSTLRKARVYTVKKGEVLSAIFRSQRGDEPVPYALIRQLNPGIKNLNRIFPGQRILLPVRDTIDLAKSTQAIGSDGRSSRRSYAVREGDSISRIIFTELDAAPEEVVPLYRLLRRLNPGVADLNHLRAGQILTLPPPRQGRPTAESIPKTAELEEKVLAETARIPLPTAEGLLGYVRPVLSRMKGTVTAVGNYFIPLKDAAQVTIDCSLIPVVELDDGSTILLDYGARLSDALKDLINQSWPNYAFLSAGELRDSLMSLQSIIRHSRNYTMINTDKAHVLSGNPELLVFPDWIIVAKKATGSVLYRQALFLLGGNEKPFPADVRNALEKIGLVVTEIADGKDAVSAEPTTASAAPDLRGLKGVALAEQLLKALGEPPIRGADVVLFNHTRDGFGLTIVPELLFQKKDTRFIIDSKKLPEQFVRILKEQGTEVILISQNASGRSLAEGLLRSLNMSVSFGHFSFRIPHDGNRVRLTAAFPALRVTTEGAPLYLIDFNVSPDILPLLGGPQGIRIGQY